jgi:hypothetical protein
MYTCRKYVPKKLFVAETSICISYKFSLFSFCRIAQLKSLLEESTTSESDSDTEDSNPKKNKRKDKKHKTKDEKRKKKKKPNITKEQVTVIVTA